MNVSSELGKGSKFSFSFGVIDYNLIAPPNLELKLPKIKESLEMSKGQLKVKKIRADKGSKNRSSQSK